MEQNILADCREAADYVLSKIPERPEIGIILGSGLSPLAGMVEDATVISYSDIPHFLRPTVPGHEGRLIIGRLGGKRIVCMSGRFHSYEGYTFEQLSMPVRILKLLGIEKLVLTNAAGAVNPEYRPGDIMIIKDQIMISGTSPLRGPNVDEFGPRFFDVCKMYSPELIDIARTQAEGSGLRFQEGVYFWMPGPQFETPAEIRMVRLLGGDAVGMSTVTEALTAAHCGIPVLGFSVLTNMGAGILKQLLTHAEVLETASSIESKFAPYVAKVIGAL